MWCEYSLKYTKWHNDISFGLSLYSLIIARLNSYWCVDSLTWLPGRWVPVDKHHSLLSEDHAVCRRHYLHCHLYCRCHSRFPRFFLILSEIHEVCTRLEKIHTMKTPSLYSNRQNAREHCLCSNKQFILHLLVLTMSVWILSMWIKHQYIRKNVLVFNFACEFQCMYTCMRLNI